ncbi:MAG: TIGR03915 family putative DNA repair protein [Lawsonibacter sp.]|nr:TIGR03915 family putative DNA repair protein [Lawsonibacter sp.]
MAWTQICCCYDGTFAGFLSCVFESYVNHEEPVEFQTSEHSCASFYPQRAVTTHREHAGRVYRSLAVKFGTAGQELVERGFLTCLPEKELWLWRLIQLGYRRGPSVTRALTDPVVDQVYKAVSHLNHEAHLFTGFVRFSQLDGVLVGEIEPKNRVLPLLRPHFCGRYPQERFLLYDRTYREALLHQPGQWAILPAEDLHIGPADKEELSYRRLWRSFYDTIAIEGRYNPTCRMTHMPKRHWGTMTEFQTDEEFSVQALPPKLP